MSTTDDLRVIKDLSKKLATNPASLAMIKANRDWPAAGVSTGAYVIFEEKPAPLNGCLVIVARLAGKNYHYVGHAERIFHRNTASVRLDDGTVVPLRAFTLRGPVVVVANEQAAQLDS